MGYDVIGDIHGQGAKLDALMRALGYTAKENTWVPPYGRQAVFLGDLIDRGPEQVRVVDAVRRMVEEKNAYCIMGNHEFNAIGFVTPVNEGSPLAGYLRAHSDKNVAQHAAFLRQVGQGSPMHQEFVDWFRTLPPFLELPGIRAAHAWWHAPYVDAVRARLAGGPVTDAFLRDAHDASKPEGRAMEGLTKGHELKLPKGFSFTDHSGVERFEVRTRWWRPDALTYRDVAMVSEDQLHRIPQAPLPVPMHAVPADGTPVFVGHYWLSGAPGPQSAKVACLDYSAAKQGPLVAYRWDGEDEIDARNFVAAG